MSDSIDHAMDPTIARLLERFKTRGFVTDQTMLDAVTSLDVRLSMLELIIEGFAAAVKELPE